MSTSILVSYDIHIRVNKKKKMFIRFCDITFLFDAANYFIFYMQESELLGRFSV